MSQHNPNQFCGRTRREFLWESGAGFTGLALTSLLSQDGFLDNQTMAADGKSEYTNPLAPKARTLLPKRRT